jgi:glycosyltransferase involved in cell wall biosynthesis
MPIVSIITPTYNHKNFIDKAIESVLAQTFSDWELIVVDDASTDQTPLIIEQYCQRDKRIKFLPHSFNWGKSRLADIYNQALELCKGKYIAILEGDDLWPAYKLEVQIPMLESDPEAVLSHGAVA